MLALTFGLMMSPLYSTAMSWDAVRPALHRERPQDPAPTPTHRHFSSPCVHAQRLEFAEFCTRCGVKCQVKCLTLNALGIEPGKVDQYPSLQSYIFNASAVKSFTIFLAHKLGSDPDLQHNEYLRIRHIAVWTAVEISRVCDHAQIALSDAECARLQWATSLHLLCFAWLHHRTSHLYLYKPVPKLHYLEHCIQCCATWCVNPNVWR